MERLEQFIVGSKAVAGAAWAGGKGLLCFIPTVAVTAVDASVKVDGSLIFKNVSAGIGYLVSAVCLILVTRHNLKKKK